MTDEPQVLNSLYSLDAEQSVLGAILINQHALDFVDLSSSEFFLHKHGFIWDAIKGLQRDGSVIDFLTITDRLEKSGQLGEIGGSVYLMDLVNRVPSWLHANAYAEIVRDYAQRRVLVEEAGKLLRAAHDQDHRVDDIVADITTSLTTISRSNGTGSLSYSELLSRHYDRMERLTYDPASAKGMQTGFTQFDDITGGIYQGEFVLFYGKPKVKKTQFIHQLAEQLAANGNPVAIFQIETPEDTIMDRDISRLSLKVGGKITTRQLETGNLQDSQWEYYTKIIDRFSNLPIYINFDQQTTSSIEAEAARLKNRHGIKIVFIDYLRLLGDSAGKADEWQRQEIIARRLKIFSRRSGLAVVAIHNLLKEGIASARPSTEDGSGGAGIPYDCDKSIFITEHIPAKGGVQEENMRTFIIDLSRRAIRQKAFNMVVLADYPCFSDPPTKDQINQDRNNGKKSYMRGEY